MRGDTVPLITDRDDLLRIQSLEETPWNAVSLWLNTDSLFEGYMGRHVAGPVRCLLHWL